MAKLKTLLCVAFAVLVVTLGLYGQQLNVGDIMGSVTDQSGAVIPDVKVVALNSGTGISQSTITTSAGIYYINRLQVGRYSVTVTKEGFRREERANIEVIAGQTFTVNFVLSVGATSQTITVTAAPPVLNATDTMQGTTRSVAEIQNLPIYMEGNAEVEALSTVQTLSGVNYNLQGNAGQGWMVVSRADINGVNGGGFGYEIDGVEAGPGEPEQAEDFMAPVPDAIDEIRMTSSTDAATGFNAGVNLNLVTKSGTNQLHGSVYYYNRNASLGAREWFLTTVGKDNENQAGFTVGGPVYIPKVYDGRNRTFFFLNMDVYRHVTTSPTVQGSLQIASVPTAAERTGDFSAALGPQIGTDALGRPIYQGEIYDPATTRLAPNGSYIRDPFMYMGQLNVIPPSRFSTVSQNLQTGYAPPNLPGITNNWTGPYAESTLPDQHYSLKIDQQIGDKQHLGFALERQFGWFFPNTGLPGICFGDHVRLSPNVLYTNAVLGAGGSMDCRDEYRYRLIYTWTAKPNLLVSFRAGVTRDPKRNDGEYPSQLANGGCAAGLKGTLSCETPEVSITNTSGFGTAYGLLYTHTQRTPFSLDISYTKGKHLFSFGAEYIAAPAITSATLNQAGTFGTQGDFSFSNNEVGLPGTTYAGEVGVGYASFLLGAVDNATVGMPWQSNVRTSEAAVYAQDKWQVTRKLTLNYGLRWELTPPPSVDDNKIASFDPSIPNPGAGDILGAQSIWGFGTGRNGLTGLGPWYMKAFAPKIGLSYAFNDKTVFRANYAVSYFPYWSKWINSNGSLVQQDPWSLTLTSESLNTGWTPAFYWDKGFPGVFPTVLPVVNPSIDNNETTVFLDANHSRPPMIENIGAELERQLPGQILARVAYVGNLTHRLYAETNLDQLPLQYLSLGSLLNDSITSPAAVAAGIKVPYTGFTGTVAQALTPYPQYLSVKDVGGQLDNSDYHSLQINVQRHFGGNLTFLANATISKSLDMANFPCACQPTNAASLRVPRQIIKTAYAPSGADIPKQMNLSWFWALPVGRGQHFLGDANKGVNALLGNWQLSAVQSYQAGFPLSLSTNESIPFLESLPPNLNQGVPIKTSGGCGAIVPHAPGKDVYLNQAAFSDPAPFTLGNTFELPSVRACGYYDEDMGLSKSFPFGESRRVMVGAMASNLFNRHQFNSMVTNIDNPSFGQFTNTSYPRTVQLYMKVMF